MHVCLINHTPEPEKTIAAAARLCYSSVGADELMDELTAEKISSLLEKLTAKGHHSPLEHASFTFAIQGVSRALTHQLVRHRIASYSQQSQRYVREDNFDYVVPPSIAANEKAKEIFERLMMEIRDAYRQLAAEVPVEDARYVLPNACETKIVCTFNARSLINFFRHRLCRRAQWEIRLLAEKMLAEVRKVAPTVFGQIGPPCVMDGRCPEGEHGCGGYKKQG
ncbi:MAG: thymidylate synthase [Eubacteriales bacterium]|nr:thymidylate synthase [Eubacteriales bacterium]